MNSDFALVVKDKDGFYFCGYNQWSGQLRKAKLYHSYKYAKETCEDDRFIEHEAYIMRIKIFELGEADND